MALILAILPQRLSHAPQQCVECATLPRVSHSISERGLICSNKGQFGLRAGLPNAFEYLRLLESVIDLEKNVMVRDWISMSAFDLLGGFLRLFQIKAFPVCSCWLLCGHFHTPTFFGAGLLADYCPFKQGACKRSESAGRDQHISD
jgi:hypothetical protein